MNKVTRFINNVRYAYNRVRRDWALDKMKEHINDADDVEWKKYAKIAVTSLKKCLEIPIE